MPFRLLPWTMALMEAELQSKARHRPPETFSARLAAANE